MPVQAGLDHQARAHGVGRRGGYRSAGWVLAMGLSCGLAIADERTDAASAHFTEGVEAFSAGDARRAAAAFAEAHRLVPHGATIYNAGVAWDTAGETARAAQALEEALDRGGLNTEQVNDAQGRLARLKPGLGRIRVVAPEGATVSVAHMRRAKPGTTIYLAPGPHVVSVTYADGRTERTTAKVGTSLLEVDFNDAGTAPDSGERAGPESAAKSGGSSSDGHRTLGWVAVGASGALAGAAIYMGLEALSARDAFNDSGQTDAGAHDRAASMRTWTNVAWGASAVAGGAGVWLLLTSGDGTAQGSDTTSPRGAHVFVGPRAISFETRF